MMKLEKQEYNVYETLEDEINLLEELEDSSASYICDAISESSDSYIPIYNGDLWEQAPKIQDSIEQAIDEGLTEGLDDLMRVFQSGFYVYYTGICHENLETVAYNVLVNHFNDLEFENKDVGELDIEEIIEDLAEDFDHNNSWDDLREEFDEKLEELIEEREEEENEDQ